MKKVLVWLMAVIMLLGVGTACAEQTSKEDLAIITDMINVKAGGEYDDISMGEEVVIDDQFSFTLNDLYFVPSEKEGHMQAYCFVTLRGQVANIGLLDYGFSLVTREEGDKPRFAYYWPVEVYGFIGKSQYPQPFAWPVVISDQEPLEILLVYEVPKTAAQFGVVYCNIWRSGEDELHYEYASQGNMKVYSMRRTPMDFRFINASGKTITELYVVPAESLTWDKNLLAAYTNPALDDQAELPISFVGAKWEEYTGKEWELRVVYEDGGSSSFVGLELDGVLIVELVPDEDQEGKYTLLLTR